MALPNMERQTSIDAVRGFAVLGILVMNIVGMGLPVFAYIDPTYAGGSTGGDLAMWAINFVITDGKMRGLFTMLFGASMVLIADRAEGARLGPNNTHYRRMFWLMLFGFAHAYLFWFGDILVCYAVAGAIAFLFRNLRPHLLIALGAAILLALLALQVISGHNIAEIRAAAAAPGATPEALARWAEARTLVDPPASLGELQTRGMLGGFMDAFQARAMVNAILYVSFFPFEVIEAVGQMLIGIALYRLGFFSLRWSTGQYLTVAAFGYLVAAPATAYLAWQTIQANFDPVELNFASAWSAAPRPFIALAHASVLLLIVRSGVAAALVNRLAAAGRMALSNYLMTSIITTLVFCGFGLGLFSKLSRAELMYVVLGVWAFMLIWSKPWLARFHYGPFEWVWRSLVQGRAQPWGKPAGAT